MQAQINKPTRTQRRAPPNELEAARQTANAYIVAHYQFGCLGGTPRRLVIDNQDLWIVPVFLTSPGVGPVGEVGVIAENDRTGAVVGNTRREDVVQAVRTLKTSKHHDLQAAFLRSRTA